MKNWMWAFAGVSVLALASCTKDQGAEPKTETKPVEAKPATPPPAAPPAAAEGEKAAAGEAGGRQMANCPSSVEGATTKIEDGEGAVLVTVTAAQEAATKEIRERSKHLAEVSAKAPAEVKHTGEGEGGGGLGNCPVVLADTTISAEEVPGGAKLTVKPSKAEDLAKLKALATERQAKAAAPAAEPAK